MFLTVHAAASLMVARSSANPAITFCVSLLSHFVLDAIPHGDEYLAPPHFTRARTLRRLTAAAAIDATLLVGFVAIYLWRTPNLNLGNVYASLAGSLLPDLVLAIAIISQVTWLEPYLKFHHRIHNLLKHKMDWAHGMFIQVMVFTGLWLTLL